MIIPFGPLEPDRSIYAFQVSTSIRNCLPVGDGWGPMPEIEAVTEALPSEPKGVALARTSAGGYKIFAGTETDLYRLDTSSVPYPWDEVTRLSGGDYAVPPGTRWVFKDFGTALTAWQKTDNPQYIDIDIGTEFADIPNAPIAKTAWVAGDFMVAGDNAGFPSRARWSAFNQIDAWEIQVRAAGLQDFRDGGEVQAGIGSEEGAIIFQRSKIRVMEKQVNVSSAFATRVLNPYLGTISPYAVVPVGPGKIIYPNEQGFFMGVEGVPIGAERVDNWFLNSEIDRDYLQEIIGMSDPYKKIAWFQYQRSDGSKAMLGYHWQLDRWCYSDQNVQLIAALATPGITWDGLDDLYATIDDVDQPYDSRLFAGGRPTLAGFTEDFRLGWFTGNNIAATLETADVQLDPKTPDQRATVDKVRLIGDCSSFTMQVGVSDFAGGPVTWNDPVTPFGTTGICHFRGDGQKPSGMFHRFRVNIPAGASWNVVIGVDVLGFPEGKR